MRKFLLVISMALMMLFTGCTSLKNMVSGKGKPKTYKLSQENIKSANGLAKKIVHDSSLPIYTPSKHIMTKVATEREKTFINGLARKSGATMADKKKLAKILKGWTKEDNFFDSKAWLNSIISGEVLELESISNRGFSNSKEENIVHSNALYTAFSDYLAPIETWKKSKRGFDPVKKK